MKPNALLPIPLALLSLMLSSPTPPARAALGEPAGPYLFFPHDFPDASDHVRREMAEALVARAEAAMKRRLDAAFRARLVESFAVRPIDQLQRPIEGGRDGALVPAALGDSRADLLYTPVTPCRAFDTRSAGGILSPGTPRDFLVAGDGLAAQGGSPSGCGVPLGPATAVVMNLTAVQATGVGHLRAWAVADPTPPAPLASVLNFGNAAGLPAIANAVVVPACDAIAIDGACPSDVRLEAFGSSTHVVGDVLGYFRRVDLAADLPFGSGPLGPATAAAGGSALLTPMEVTMPAARVVTCVVTCSITVSSAAANATGEASVRGGAASIESGLSVFGGRRMSLAPVAVPGASSASQSVAIGFAGGGRIQFGCRVDSSGDFLGDELTGTVAWTCR